jgi:hypothetical protein
LVLSDPVYDFPRLHLIYSYRHCFLLYILHWQVLHEDITLFRSSDMHLGYHCIAGIDYIC